MNGGRFEAAHSIARRRWNGLWQCACIFSFGVVAWSGLLVLPQFPVTPELDWSWAGALPYFAQRGFHFGTDIIFTYGPLGHFVSYAYTEYLTTERTVWEFVIKALAAALFCWALCELRPTIRVSLAVCIILFLGAFEEAYAFMAALIGLLLLRSTERRLWIHALLGLFLAVLALVKFTHLIQGMCAIGAVCGYYYVRRLWLALAVLAVSFIGGLLACWGLAGQNVADIFPYVTNSWAITSGYNAAMFTATPDITVIWVAAFTGMLLLLQLALFWFHARDKARVIFGSILLMLMLFILWKHAFTRWHNHAPKFFLLFPELLLASWLLSENGSRPNRWALALTGVAIMSALFGQTLFDKSAFSHAFAGSRDKLLFAWSVVTHYPQFDEERRLRLAAIESKFSLPKTRALVGDRAVDVFGYRQGIALLNGLNYVPRPIFQGYSAYTPSLIAANTRHYQSVKRPEFIISKLETIDDRFPTLDDSGVLLELLYHYRPILSENGWQLWEVARPVEAIKRQPIAKLRAKLGQYVPIPDNVIIWIELEVQPTRWGRITGFLYKCAPIYIELEDDAGLRSRYRIIPSMTSSGWLLNPGFTNGDQLVLAAMGTRLPRYKLLSVTTDPGDDRFFKKTVEIKFSALPNITPFSRDPSP